MVQENYGPRNLWCNKDKGKFVGKDDAKYWCPTTKPYGTDLPGDERDNSLWSSRLGGR